MYDANGNVKRYTDRDGCTYQFDHISWNQIGERQDPTGARTQYRHTSERQTAQVVDPGGTVHDYRYDLKDRLVQVHRHGVVKETYEYDPADNLIRKLDANGQVLLERRIGRAGLVTDARFGDGKEYYFSHDDQGRCTAMESEGQSVTFEYDFAGNRTADLRDGTGVTHEYDARGLTAVTVLDKFTVRYQWDESGCLFVWDPTGSRQALRRNKNCIEKQLSNGTWVATAFDSNGRCTQKVIRHNHGASEAWIRDYLYSAEGDLLAIQDSRQGDTHYEYDKAHRLKRANDWRGSREEYRYDAAGNLLRKPGLGGVFIPDGNRLRAANGAELEFNHRNAVSTRTEPGRTVRYSYDCEDQLTEVTWSDSQWQGDYDGLGRLIRKTFNGAATDYYWYKDRLAGEVHHDGRVRVYVYADDFALMPFMFLDYSGISESPESGKPHFIFCDQRSTPFRVEDAPGRVVWSAHIGPYGDARIERADIQFNLRFPGHYDDPDLRLHYNRFRYFDPALGRYIQSDPMGIAGGLNLYAYCDNPLVEVDVRGLRRKAKPCPPATQDQGEDDTQRGEAGHAREQRYAPRKHPGGKKGKQKTQLLAEEYAHDLRNTVNAPTKVTVVRNKKTGKIYKARSGDPKLDPNDAHPNLGMPTKPKTRKVKVHKRKKGPKRGKVLERAETGGESPAQAEQRGRPKHDPNNCSEPKAINDALKDDPNKSNLQVATIDVQTGKPAPCCKWCQQTTKGTTVLTG